MLKLDLYHGRVSNPEMLPTTLEGAVVEDWGFQGPVLEGIEWLTCTYGTFCVRFESEAAFETAKRLTGWDDGTTELSLEIAFFEDLVRIHHPDRLRDEFYGDWSLDQIE